MLSSTPRRQASLSKGAEPELQGYLASFSKAVAASKKTDFPAPLNDCIRSGHCIRQALIENTDTRQTRDVFRLENGFELLLAAFQSLSEIHRDVFDISGGEQLLLDYLQTLFSILSAALQEHRGNRRFFKDRVIGGGWQQVRDSLLPLLPCGSSNQHIGLGKLLERVFGCLLACALDDESMIPTFSRFRNSAERQYQRTRLESSDERLSAASGETNSDSDARSLENRIDSQFQGVLKGAIDSSAFVHNAEPIVVLFELWKYLQDDFTNRACSEPPAYQGVLDTILFVGDLSTHNLAALHSTNLLNVVLLHLTSSSLKHSQTVGLRSLALSLLTMGVSTLDDARFLYSKASSSPLIANILLTALKMPHSPSYVHFDLSLHGFSSIELPGIGKAFPPTASSGGYTLSIWFNVIRFDSNCHTTIFGAYESSQTCFVLVYLEKDSRNLILQTSVTSSRPSVRFKSTSFDEGRWYHVVIVHRRPRTTVSSRASLFVDGDFVEQARSSYPLSPPAPILSSDRIGSGPKSSPIQAFFGTPQDLAPRLGKGLTSLQWRLASAHLFGEVLTDDLIAVHYQLGPRYYGNYQDCLGSFQTYKASAALNIRNEMLHPGKEEKSDIVSAIRQKASALLPETQVILNISPSVVLDDDDQNDIDERQLLKGLGKQASKNLRSVTRGGRNALAINGSIPSINEALQYSSGFAVLTGNPAVVVPQALDDASWRIGGCAAIGLALVDAAKTPENLLVSLQILLECIKDSWRNSEAMERENGFGVLASLLTKNLDLLRAKLFNQAAPEKLPEVLQQHEMLSLEVLTVVLRFIGYQPERPRESVINNALAYRILLIDVDTWRNAAPSVQSLYYGQFSIFGRDSKYHYFNTKRLSKMRITKKWLEALKMDRFTADTFDYFLDAFKIILTPQPSAECLRSLAMFITYARHTPRKQESSPLRPTKSTVLLGESTKRKQTLSTTSSLNPSISGTNEKSELDRGQIALRVMELYTSLLCDNNDTVTLRKFGRIVTNRWLLFLLADDEPKMVALATKLLARLLITNGASYVQKFAGKTSGVIIMQNKIKRWWNIPAMWLICFAILFGQDVASINMEQQFDFYNLIETFVAKCQARVTYPEILPVITAMLQAGLRAVTRDEPDPDSPLNETEDTTSKFLSHDPQLRMVRKPSPSMSLKEDLQMLELLAVLFPIITSSDTASPEAELHARDSSLTFQGNDVVIRPLSQAHLSQLSLIKKPSPEIVGPSKASRVQAPRRMSSYVFVPSARSQESPPTSKPQIKTYQGSAAGVSFKAKNSIVEEILEILISVFADQLFSRKDFPGLGLFMKVPPGFQEYQAYFETFILQNTLSSLGNTINLNQKILWEPRVLTNLARFATHLSEAVYEGWFINGVDVILGFLGSILEYLQLPDVAKIKSVRLCNQMIATLRSVLLRVILLGLSELDATTHSNDIVMFLEKLVYWQNVVLVTQDGQDYYLRLLLYLLYHLLIGPNEAVRMAAVNLWRMLLVQRQHHGSNLMHEALGDIKDNISRGFAKILEVDNETFIAWINEHRQELDSIFLGTLGKLWATYVAEENSNNLENSEARINKRREKLKIWQSETLTAEEALRRHEISADHWRSNIYTSEHLRRQRSLQDAQDNAAFNISTWNKMNQELKRPCGIFEEVADLRWQLDPTEGRNRMRKRLIPDGHKQNLDMKPKRKQSQGPNRSRGSSLGVRSNPPLKNHNSESRSSPAPPDVIPPQDVSQLGAIMPPEPIDENAQAYEEGFEIVEDPQEDYEDYEDKNRKVVRSLERGDQIEHVTNVSRIIGLEACEGLLILGKDHLYLLDNLFQRSDSEIVNVWQAPQSERDPYVQMISGREAGERAPSVANMAHEARSWRWEDVLSISKRRFLFRDVAVEVFFVDGRSYLLTSSNVTIRNDLYQRLQEKASHFGERSLSADHRESWRIESVRNTEDENQTLGARFTSVFAQTHSNPATRRWIKGEISNFQYLMLINTMAGRTFNDLTQYPIFPWVLADYTSDELDLSDPKTFRDLTKPMGCQSPERQAEFRERYHTFAEMNEGSPSFHYGTHYSSAMIVTSYLIRLQPFVQSYLLLQGGNFDHPDRLFYSIEKAWCSASRENMTDVRELVPEFYYLPEFLLNSNGYDFGMRQGDGGPVDTVALPPWAKGDPKIFIAKHREALECEHVSKHLHHWIDLVFGHKQRGDAAVEATNVFHHLSYHGAKDLDNISDPLERLATIGIIHNFGQTPYQIFQRPHSARDDMRTRTKRLDMAIESLTRLPFPVLVSRSFSALLSASSDGHVLLWDLNRLKLVRRLAIGERVEVNHPNVLDEESD
ncbi:MAG: hypothetical protein Q9195_005837 [Heterodermia aff. obscurata]